MYEHVQYLIFDLSKIKQHYFPSTYKDVSSDIVMET